MRIDPKSTAVDLSRAAKQWQSLGEAKIAAGRNASDPNPARRLSNILDAVAPLEKARQLWTETAKLLREAGSSNERSAMVADREAASCGRQAEYCGEAFHDTVMHCNAGAQQKPSPLLTRIIAYEFERNADSRPLDWLIERFREDPVLGRRECWGADVDLWWLG